MKRSKKRSYFSHSLFILIFLSLFAIIYVASKDFMMTPPELFETAQKAERAGEYKKAERYYLSAASNTSNPDTAKIAAYYLGRLYRTGGDKSFPIDGKKAEMFLEQAALQNVPQAQYELALMYDVGDKIPSNREKALLWMNKAAQNGWNDALYSLGVFIERGYLGKPDMEKVLVLYEKAAENGNIFAMTSLIALYSGGFQGITPNLERAQYWMQILQNKNKSAAPQAIGTATTETKE